jgi:phage/conjugal plasmid C-4 type zinc finger TraR family protein
LAEGAARLSASHDAGIDRARHEGRLTIMATGWAQDGAVQDQIDDTVSDGVRNARARMPAGPGALTCVECDEDIPAARRHALPGVTTCIACQSTRDTRITHSAINRRGSKDSQLR